MSMLENRKIEICSRYVDHIPKKQSIRRGLRKAIVYEGKTKKSIIFLYKDGMPEIFLSVEKSNKNKDVPKEYYRFNQSGDVTQAMHFDKDGSESFLFNENKKQNDIKAVNQELQKNIITVFKMVDYININHPPLNDRMSYKQSIKIS